ncbi:MAG: hypothetical protein LBQ05_02155 [Christensenellaceae bacterium]|jgi:hypothetical protein|nr:hypothetical protein [Christensenellaceae bacterium]
MRIFYKPMTTFDFHKCYAIIDDRNKKRAELINNMPISNGHGLNGNLDEIPKAYDKNDIISHLDEITELSFIKDSEKQRLPDNIRSAYIKLNVALRTLRAELGEGKDNKSFETNKEGILASFNKLKEQIIVLKNDLPPQAITAFKNARDNIGTGFAAKTVIGKSIEIKKATIWEKAATALTGYDYSK